MGGQERQVRRNKVTRTVEHVHPAAYHGLAFGSVYALIALGYTMVYGILQLINFRPTAKLYMLVHTWGSSCSGVLTSGRCGELGRIRPQCK